MKYIITHKQYQLLKEDEQKILQLPSIEYFGGWDGLQKYLKKKGNPLYSINGDLDLRGTPIKSLGNLTSVGGNLDLEGTPIKSLGNLTSVGGYLDLRRTPISKKFSRQEIRNKVDVQGTILLK
jgi:hypothetical protein